MNDLTKPLTDAGMEIPEVEEYEDAPVERCRHGILEAETDDLFVLKRDADAALRAVIERLVKEREDRIEALAAALFMHRGNTNPSDALKWEWCPGEYKPPWRDASRKFLKRYDAEVQP